MFSTCGRATALAALALIASGCSGSPTQPSAPAPAPSPVSSLGFSIQIETGRQAAFPQRSPMRVRIGVRDGGGALLPITGGTLTARDGTGGLLATTMVPAAVGETQAELVWAGTDVFAHGLDLRIEILDAAGARQIIEHTVPL
jgi:hypothetical protein